MKYCCKLLFILMMGLCLSAKTLAHHQQKDTEKARFEELSFIVTTSKKDFLKLEPIKFNLKVINNSGKEVLGRVRMEFFHSYIHLLITHNGVTKNFDSLFFAHATDCTAYHQPPKIKPDQEITLEQVLFYNLEEMFFEEGSYQLQFIINNRNPPKDKAEELKSNILNIEIINPIGDDLKAFSSYKELQGFMQGESLKENDFQKAFIFIKSFRNSTYFIWVKNQFLEYKYMKDSTKFSDEEKLFIESSL